MLTPHRARRCFGARRQAISKAAISASSRRPMRHQDGPAALHGADQGPELSYRLRGMAKLPARCRAQGKLVFDQTSSLHFQHPRAPRVRAARNSRNSAVSRPLTTLGV
jgi:hypothetical protein